MSMLAERKRKTKWVINPTKTPLWTQESSGIKFGKDLMEKMGWSAGKGLGLNEQGIEEPLRLSHKNDKKGMGFKGHDDDWIEYQDEFNMLLRQLSNNGDTAVLENSEMKKPKIESLEMKSKHSRARVHYQKFTRGKDLSNYSENDLACILGTNKPKKEKSKSEVYKTNNENKCETSFGVTTINSGSIKDYFKKKFSLDKDKSLNSLKAVEATENVNENFSDTRSAFSMAEDNENIDAKEKKHKKRKHKLEADSLIHESTENSSKTLKDQTLNFSETENEKGNCKKRKAMKSTENSSKNPNDQALNLSETENEKGNCKKRKAMKSTENSTKNLKDQTLNFSETENEKRSCKKRKAMKSTAESQKTSNNQEFEISEEKIEKKKKKVEKNFEETKSRKKKQYYNFSDGISESKKKKHKSEDNITEIEVVDEQKPSTPSEKYEKKNNESADIIDLKDNIEKKSVSVENNNDSSIKVAKSSKSSSEMMNAEAKRKKDAIVKENIPKERRYTSERVLDLICWADIKEFKGSNLRNVLGYGFKKEYLRNKV